VLITMFCRILSRNGRNIYSLYSAWEQITDIIYISGLICWQFLLVALISWYFNSFPGVELVEHELNITSCCGLENTEVQIVPIVSYSHTEFFNPPPPPLYYLSSPAVRISYVSCSNIYCFLCCKVFVIFMLRKPPRMNCCC
jgi:hypothetical protein